MAAAVPSPRAPDLASRYEAVRRTTERLCEPLSVEDFVVQSMPDVSPTKWHIAHVTWFFETFVLKPLAGYEPLDPAYEYLFNSYYNAVGEQFPRHQRGLLSRPTVADVMAYRRHVDDAMASAFAAGRFDEATCAVIELGLNHEQQHQELLLMDIKHVLNLNPLRPAYQPGTLRHDAADAVGWRSVPGGRHAIGAGEGCFAFDNERPRHEREVPAFRVADRPVSNGEYLAFIADGGYRNPALWLSDGWAMVQDQGFEAPLYWRRVDDGFLEFTLRGEAPVDPDAPVCHVSYYEADAFATWAGHRLPDEFEWEVAAAGETPDTGFLDEGRLHPAMPPSGRFCGGAWTWTRSAYHAYPGYRPAAGALGEYNGKFMCNQLVLRGGSCVTPGGHARTTYRNFFYPHMRWQFAGIRLADDV